MPDLDPTAPRSRYAPPGQAVRAHWDYDHDDESDDLAYGEDDALLIERAEAEQEQPASAETAVSAHSFTHLHVHSEYSLLDGLSSIQQIVNETRRLGMSSVALTDHGNLYGAVDFYSAAKAAGIKPIIGVEAYVSPRGMSDRSGKEDRSYFHLVLLAQNHDGYQNLLKLVTRASLDGFYYKPRVDRDLLAEHADGLIALSACYSGEPSRAILDGNPDKARAAAGWYREVFGENYFLEIQDHGNPDDQVVNRGLIDIHRELGIPLVATNDSHYAAGHQADAQDLLLCIQTSSVITDQKRMRMQPAAFYLKSPDEMWQLFQETPQAITNTMAIAERCDLHLEFGRLNFPALDHLVPRGELPLDYLRRTCRERLVTRYGPRLTEDHRKRLEYELGVIETTGFASYILFVWDFVEWARKRGIPCGPRGSAAGSIILYCLGISDVDPVLYGLTFERFLNPERIEMPDIDMDFADDRRDEVIQYVVDRYGRDRVAQIITFGRLQARAAIRDVGRALGYPLNDVDRVAKLVPSIPIGLKIDQAMDQNPELKRLYESEASVKTLIDTAKGVEGVARHAGTHAAGVVVADQPLVNYVPLQKASRGDSVMTQYPQKVLDKIGLLKMDFLGLANLTMLARALANIRQTRGEHLDLSQIDYADRKTYDMLGRGETRTVFQLEGSGMTRYIQELKPVSVDHLAAMVALYRPGPMAQIPSYIARRDGREPPMPPDPALEDALKESYGVIVYQDQVLRVVRDLAGYSLGQADVLRKAMGKKIKSVMEEEGPKFLKAAQERGHSRQTAERIWELLQPFAGYAFNKAHAYCYAFVAYQTAYLKANYPAEWFAAVLSTVSADTDKVVGVVGECRRMGIEVLPPRINRSRSDFAVETIPGEAPNQDARNGIRFGLCAVKNVGEGAVEHIINERDEHGPFRDLEDFCRRLDLHTVNKRVIESLAKCGALDDFGPREAVLKAVDSAMASAQRDQKAASSGQVSLFGAFGGEEAAPGGPGQGSAASPYMLPSAPAVTPRERAAWEKEVLGFNFANHPFQEAAPWLAARVTQITSNLSPEGAGEKVTMAGALTAVRKIFTKTKGQMAVVTLEDLHGSVEAVVFPRAYEKQPDLWVEDRIVVIEGKVDLRDDKIQLVVDTAEEWVAPAPGTPPPPPVESAITLVKVPASVSNPNAAVPVSLNGHSHMNGHANGTNGRASSNGATEVAEANLRVVVPNGPDDDCLRILQQLHNLLNRFPGTSQMRLLIERGDCLVEMKEAPILVQPSSDFVSQVQSLVGAQNVQVAAAAAVAA